MSTRQSHRDRLKARAKHDALQVFSRPDIDTINDAVTDYTKYNLKKGAKYFLLSIVIVYFLLALMATLS